MAARGSVQLPEGVEAGLDAETVYDPPNLTFPFGAYICVVDIDPGTAKVKVRRFVAVDDCGVRINPMIVEGQVHGGLTDGVGMALMEQISFDEEGNCLNGSLMDYLIPTSLEVPDWETGLHRHAVAAPSDRRQGDRRVGHGRVAADDRKCRLRRARALRRQARRHALHSLAGVGRDALRALRRLTAMIRGQLAQRASSSRRPRAVRAGDRRARPPAHERPRR